MGYGHGKGKYGMAPPFKGPPMIFGGPPPPGFDAFGEMINVFGGKGGKANFAGKQGKKGKGDVPCPSIAAKGAKGAPADWLVRTRYPRLTLLRRAAGRALPWTHLLRRSVYARLNVLQRPP
eukprot:gene11608-20037_t